jgi:erythritol kinase (D-erythritol 1-phosphate-forming)
MRDLIVGLDAGTSMIKAVAFTSDGHEVATASRTNTHATTPDGGATMDMARVWADCVAVLRDLASRLDPVRDRIAAMGVTGQGDGTVLVDRAGVPVCDAILWLDRRAADWVSGFVGSAPDRARFLATGTGLTACQQGAQLNWMRTAMPDALDRAATACHCKDWLYWQLTGVRATDPCEASFSFGNFRTRTYDDTVITALGLADLRHLLPPVLDGAVETHALTSAAAQATGLPAGLPVALGYLDAACTALGAGVHEGGQGFGCTIVGSTGVHLKGLASEDVVLDTAPGGYVLVLPIPGRVAQMQTNMSGTLNLDWVLGLGRDLVADCGHPPPDLLARLEGWLVEGSQPPPIYHPYVSRAGERGPFVDPNARAGFLGLDTGHGYPDLVRAVVEGLSMAARDCYDAMGGVPAEVRLTGGAARSDGVRRIMAETLGVPLRQVLRQEAGAAGAAMIAAVSTGAWADMETCIAQWVSPHLGPAETPDPAATATRAARFETYRMARSALPPVWAALAAPCPDRPS